MVSGNQHHWKQPAPSYLINKPKSNQLNQKQFNYQQSIHSGYHPYSKQQNQQSITNSIMGQSSGFMSTSSPRNFNNNSNQFNNSSTVNYFSIHDNQNQLPETFGLPSSNSTSTTPSSSITSLSGTSNSITNSMSSTSTTSNVVKSGNLPLNSVSKEDVIDQSATTFQNQDKDDIQVISNNKNDYQMSFNNKIMDQDNFKNYLKNNYNRYFQLNCFYYIFNETKN
jgi:hypothetical protein